MAGGLLSLVSVGQQNVILNSNPEKSFWKTTFKRYTNWGKQNFTLNYEGTPTLNMTTNSTFVFKVKRFADLLMDCYITIDMPTIWSPLFPPQEVLQPDGTAAYTNWAPYEFRWIDNLGTMMIEKISITCGNQKLQEYSGRYMLAAVQRDFSAQKKRLFDEMTGNVPEMADPANAGARVNAYPNAFFTENPAGAQPSINGRKLYIPLGAWFNLKPQNAFPLVSLQYNELQISVTFRPVNQLFKIRDVLDYTNNFPFVAPNFNQFYMQFYRFLQTPPNVDLGPLAYVDTRTNFNANITLNCTYCFLSNDESQYFAKKEQKYLIKQVHERPFYNITNQNKVQLESLGMVVSWMFYFQRSDVNLRNEWTNYTNWPYEYMPVDVSPAPSGGAYSNPNPEGPATIGPGTNPDGTLSGLMLSGTYTPQNVKTILVELGILFDGQYRENMLAEGVYNFIEKYTRTDGVAPNGMYCYNFGLDTSPFSLQPSGAMNMSRFTNIEFEFSTINPPVDPYAQVLTICDPTTGEIVGINKPSWRIFEYNFDLYVMEERVNMVVFVGGNAGLLYAM